MRILVVASHPASLVNFRGPLLQAMIASGHRVEAAAPDLLVDESTLSRLALMNVKPHDIPMARTGLDPFADLRSFTALNRLMKDIKPDATLAYTIKPVIWGSLAAAFAGVPRRFALITGLGYAFTGQAKGKRRLIQALARWLYRKALKRCGLVFFQNPDDLKVFQDLGLLSPATQTKIVNGSGVDMRLFPPASIGNPPLRFLLIARLLGDKGIREYAAAAKMIRKAHPEVTFHLVGGTDSNPDAIPTNEIEKWVSEGTLITHGELKDVRPEIADCHVYVLPSYREGTPRTVLEAMSMGRAIITTDAPGCRETTIPGQTGYLVPPRDAEALAAAMERFIEEPGLVHQFGAAARQLAEEKYDVHKVNDVMLKAMHL